jgi:predicted transcriptional regulator
LNEKKIVIRGQNNLSGGGYVYIYRINDKVIIRNKIMDIIKEWAKKVEYELDRW